MKKLSFLALAAVALLFGACASNDAVDEKGSNPLEGEGQGYFKVGINLPSTPITRADWNEDGAKSQLKDGKASEWAVKSTLLLIFSGATEADATLAQVNIIADPASPVTDDPNQITVNREDYVVKLTAPTTSNLYALAVINGSGIIEQGSAAGTIKINGGADQSGVKIGDLQAAISNADALTGANKFVDGSNYIFMTNAVLFNKQGGRVDPGATEDVHILAPIDAARIYETEAAASAGEPAVDIYVERGVAKVTLEVGDLNETALKRKDGTTLVAAALDGWCLDNTNMKSYLVRQVKPATPWAWNLVNENIAASTTNDKYRFVGQTPVDGYYGTKVAGYRTYWCNDPNYDIAYAAANFWEPVDPTAKAWTTAVGEDNPLYCYENTFDVAHQTYKNTTRAIVGIKLNGGADFYTVGADQKTLWLDADIKTQATTYILGQSKFATWFAGAGSGTLDDSKVKIEWNKAATVAGTLKVEKVTIDKSVLTSGVDMVITASSLAPLDEVISTLNTQLGTVKRYKGGVAYYNIRIQHFGEDLTPWGWNGEVESSIAQIYPNTGSGQDANYLGRYGMVRNNWYEIKLGEIIGLGRPTVTTLNRDPTDPDPNDPEDPTPEDPDHPDDSKEDAYIKARINILSWAKRPQTWNLKK